MLPVFRDVPGSVMDDSGRSVFPFYLEGDSFLLSILADMSLDTLHSGQTLAFVYLFEKHLKRLTEGHREMSVVFFEDVGTFFEKSSFISFLRQLVIAHLRRTLSIPVHIIPTCDESYLNFQRNQSPLFHIMGDGYLTAEQATRVQNIASFGDENTKIDLDSINSKLSNAIQFLAAREIRVVRLAEINSGSGMLTGLIVVPSESDLTKVKSVTVHLENKFEASSPNDVTVELFEKILQQVEAALPTVPFDLSRIALAVSTLVKFFKNTNNTVPAAERNAYAIIFLAHVLLLEDLPLDSRAHRDELLADLVHTTTLRSFAKEMYGMMSYFAYELSLVESEDNTSESYPIVSDTVASRGISALRDIFDGRILHRVHTLQLEGSLLSLLTSDVLSTLCTIINKETNVSLSPSDVSKIASVLKSTPLTQSTTDSIYGEFSDFKQVEDGPLSAKFLSCWKVLPETDPLLVRVLLSGTGEDVTEVDTIYSKYSSGADMSSTVGKTASAASKSAEEDVADDWDAESDSEETAKAPKAEESGADDWEEESDYWEEEADDWEAEAEEDVQSAMKEMEISSETSTSTKTPSAANSKLLGGPLDMKKIDDVVPYWDSDKPLPDGASMKVGMREQQLEVNPVRLRPATKYMFRKFLDLHRTTKNGSLAYNFPSEKDIQDRVRLVSRELTYDKAVQWLRAAIEIRVRKFENQAIIRAESTKEHYIQSMNIPSKIILRDIVETADTDESEKTEKTEKSTQTQGGKATAKNQKSRGGKEKCDKEESIKEKAARETNERLAQQAFTEVERFINNSLKQSRLSLDKKIERLDERLLASSDIPSTFFGLMELLRMRVQLWKGRIENKSRSASISTAAYDAALDSQMEAAVRLLQLLNDLARRFIGVMSVSDCEEVQRAYQLLGFQDSSTEFGQRWAKAHSTSEDDYARHLSQVNTDASAGRLLERRFAVGMSRARFVLQYAGHTLLRNVDSARDPRVSGFYPDKWQRKLLDIVDNNESSLVVAPTSAGKTLVSFYTVDKVARENKELKSGVQRGVVVFIAPTFPLARQMESDILMRSKASVHLHDTNHKLTANMNFDVLITVPSTMENLLLSPERATWLQRVRYVVFDEVHSIGSTLNCPNCERIFLLIHQ